MLQNRSVLVTGGAGFIGSNFILYCLEKFSEENFKIINLDACTYAADLSFLDQVNDDRYCFVKGDICDKNLVEHLFKQHDITDVVHFAAESHVDNSIENPIDFVKTNVMGTFTLLDVAKNYWQEDAKSYADKRFHHISTDEVYGTLGLEGAFTEESNYAPNSPYSASKASSDMLVRSFHHTYGLNVVTTNCSNNYGPRQHDEKLIPTVIRKALAGNSIPIYGNGKNIRDWLYVEDHCEAILKVFSEGQSGETYNVGSCNEVQNIDIAKQICGILDQVYPREDKQSYSRQITFVQDRLGHDLRYAIDPSKMEKALGWRAKTPFEEGIRSTVEWYMNKYCQLASYARD